MLNHVNVFITVLETEQGT